MAGINAFQRTTTACAVILFLSLVLTCYGQGDFSAALEVLKTISKLPPLQQEAMLYGFGASFQAKTGTDCNIFGGTLACKALPTDSSFRTQCPAADTKVDCAFYPQVLGSYYDTPVDDLQAYLSRQAWAPAADTCPQCFSKLQSLWCALAAPRCGTFRAYTRLALLPALTSVEQAYEAGADGVQALVDVVGDVVDAVGAALPCREMCEDLVTTCGCSAAQTDTFGQLLEWMSSMAEETGFKVPAAFERALFKRVWDRPFCSLFAPRTSANFTGVCAPAPTTTCTAPEAWCARAGGSGGANGESVLRLVQGIVVMQFVRAAAGWITDDPAGLWGANSARFSWESEQQQQEDLVAKYVDARVQPEAAAPQPAGLGGMAVAAIVVGSVMAGAALMAAGLMAYRYLTARRAEQRYCELRTGGAFKPLSEDDI